jgi:GntR family transcriptional regulator, galactonate operon transcriptional repressor
MLRGMARRYQEVMRDLVDAVVGGEFAEGAWLPSEAELAARLGASRGVLREALRGLEERGLVAVQPGRGQRVRSREDWDVRSPDVLLAAIERGPERAVLDQAIAARAVVERAAAAEAALRAGAADLDLLAVRVTEMAQALEPGAVRTFAADDPLVDAEVWFHHTLIVLSGNDVLARLVQPLHAPLAELRRARAPERDGAVVRHHRTMLEGVSSRDPAFAEETVGAYARSLARWLGARR